MTLIYLDYELHQDGDRFDLHKKVFHNEENSAKKVQRTDKKGEPITKVIGYSYKLETAINRMAFDISDEVKDTIDLKTFIEAFREIVTEIKNNLL